MGTSSFITYVNNGFGVARGENSFDNIVWQDQHHGLEVQTLFYILGLNRHCLGSLFRIRIMPSAILLFTALPPYLMVTAIYGAGFLL